MSPEERIDFGPLDPARDRQRWERLIASTTARALASRRPVSFAVEFLAWARPALAIAAALALLVWTAAVFGRAARATQPEPAFQLAQWAAQDQLPPTGTIVQVLGGSHVGR